MRPSSEIGISLQVVVRTIPLNSWFHLQLFHTSLPVKYKRQHIILVPLCDFIQNVVALWFTYLIFSKICWKYEVVSRFLITKHFKETTFIIFVSPFQDFKLKRISLHGLAKIGANLNYFICEVWFFIERKGFCYTPILNNKNLN